MYAYQFYFLLKDWHYFFVAERLAAVRHSVCDVVKIESDSNSMEGASVRLRSYIYVMNRNMEGNGIHRRFKIILSRRKLILYVTVLETFR